MKTLPVPLRALLALAPLAGLSGAHQDPLDAQAEHETVVQRLSDTAYRLTVFGANVGFTFGPEGILMVDGNLLEHGPQLELAMADLYFEWRERTQGVPRPEPGVELLPFRWLVNTHWHGDHVLTNAYFGMLGARIVAHESVLPRLRGERRLHPNRIDPPIDEVGLPTILVRDQLELHFNGQPVRILHFPGAHTDGDMVVWLPESKLAFLGDLYWQRAFPYIELMTGGRPGGILRAIEKLFELLPPDTIVVPGHGEATGLDGLRNFYEMLSDCDRQVREFVAAGRPISEAYSTALFGAYEPFWGENKRDRVRGFIQIMWYCYAPRARGGLGQLEDEAKEREQAGGGGAGR